MKKEKIKSLIIILIAFLFIVIKMGYESYAIEQANVVENTQKSIIQTNISKIADKVYTGSSITPGITIKDGNYILKNGKDYTISYSNNKNIGKATITITGKGNYIGTVKKTFNIVQRNIKNANVSKISTYKYTGEQKKPKVVVKYGGKKLTNGKDYTVSYKNNKNPGKATIYIKGKGIYTGTITKTFYIKLKTPTVKKVSNKTKTSLKITWKKDTKVSGYVLYMANSKNGKYKKIKTIKSNKTTSYTKKGLKKNKSYYIKIKSYKTVKGKKIYSNYSSAKTNARLLASKTLKSKSNTNRNKNLKLAAKACNGIVLKPGQQFKWSKVVGKASKAKGYKKATVFVGGKSVKGYGGGVCQISTALYQSAKASKLKIIERHTHSKAVSYAKKGQEATVAHGSKDLIFKNNKSYSIKIVITTYKGQCTCKFYRVS